MSATVKYTKKTQGCNVIVGNGIPDGSVPGTNGDIYLDVSSTPVTRYLYSTSWLQESSAKIKLHDYSAPYDYCGTAISGSLTSSAVWTITRITINGNGTTVKSIVNNAIWDNRYSLSYP